MCENTVDPSMGTVLLEIDENLDPLLRGKDRERSLKQQWRAMYPTIPSRGSALKQKLYRLWKTANEACDHAVTPPVAVPDSVDRMSPELDSGNAMISTPLPVSYMNVVVKLGIGLGLTIEPANPGGRKDLTGSKVQKTW